MAVPTRREFQVGTVVVRLAAAKVDLPKVKGWVGTWVIYRAPMELESMPLRYGDTDIQASEDMAIGMARTIAALVARSL